MRALPERPLLCEACGEVTPHVRARYKLSRWGIWIPLIVIAWLTRLRLYPFLILAVLWFVWAWNHIRHKTRSGPWRCVRCESRERKRDRHGHGAGSEMSIT